MEWQPWRWILAIFLFVALTLALVGTWLAYDRHTTLLLAQSRLEANHNAAVLTVSRWLRDVEAALKDDTQQINLQIASGQPLLSPSSSQKLREMLIQQSSRLPPIISFSLLNKDGNWVISSRFSQIPVQSARSKRPIWDLTIHTRPDKTFLIRPMQSPMKDLDNFVLGRVAYNSVGHISGIALAFLSPEVLRQPFIALISAHSRVIFTDQRRQVILSVPESSTGIPAWMAERWQSVAYHGGGFFRATDPTGRTWMVVTSSAPESIINFTVMKPESDVLSAWWGYYQVVLTGTLIGLLATVILFSLWLRQRWQTSKEAQIASRARQDLLHSLTHDATTRQLNRKGFMLALQHQHIAFATLHCIGVDRLQAIAETLGHHTGNSLLRQLIDRANSIVTPGDLIARSSENTFMVLQQRGDAQAYAEKLLRVLVAPCLLGGRQYLPGITIGVAPANRPQNTEQLLRDAGLAMRHAQKRGQNQICFFTPEMAKQEEDHLLLEQEFRAAIGTDQLYMVYQPVCHLVSGQITGFEALMRWDNPSRGKISPEIFIPLAESSSLLCSPEQMVKRSPLMAATRWPHSITLSVNCTAVEFLDPTMPLRFIQQLQQAGIAPQRCFIEITESALLQDNDTVLNVMNDLKARGVRIAMDDFGSGHASLSYLVKFPFDRLKIDKSFIQSMDSSSAAASIVEAAISLSHQLNIEVVAEGVETMAQLRHLQALRCTCIQGWLIGHPMPEEQVPDFLANFSLPLLPTSV